MTKVIADKRQSGKTTKLIIESAETGFYIVTQDHSSAYTLSEVAADMGLNIPFPLTYDEFINRLYYGAGVKGVLVDNADMLIQYISTVTVHTITISIP